MNYFELFDMSVSFYPDMGKLKKQYFQKSREFHPDFYTQSSEEEKQNALDQTSLINTAYKTLQDVRLRFRHILILEDIIQPDLKEVLPQEFLFEMMDINERVEELNAEENKNEITELRNQIIQLEGNLLNDVKHILIEYPNIEKDKLNGVKDYLSKSKYLNRILDKLA